MPLACWPLPWRSVAQRRRVYFGGHGGAGAGPIAGGGGIYIMPCQLHPSVWGCYLIDIDRQTLAVYEYQAGGKNLALVAARYFRYDLSLRRFRHQAKLVGREENGRRRG